MAERKILNIMSEPKIQILMIIDRDINAAINIARRGRKRLTRSLHNMEKGRSSEAMKQSKEV